MAKLQIKKGSTDVTLYVFIQDSSSTTGGGLTGLVYNSASLVCYYVRPLGSATELSLATQTVTGAHSDGGFVEVSSSNMPGVYRLDLSDTIVSSGVNSVAIILKGAANMAPVLLEIELVAYDPQDATALGLSLVPCNVTQISGDSTAADNLETAADGGSYNLGGGGVVAASVTGAVGSVTGNVGGNVVGSVASVTAGVTLAASAVQAIWDALTSALTTVGSIGKLLVDSINATISSRSSHSAADVWAVGTRALTDKANFTLHADYDAAKTAATQASVDDLPTNAELATALDPLPTASENASAVWDRDATAHQTQGTFGQAIGDPGADSDTIWELANTNLNATVSSRAIAGDAMALTSSERNSVADAILARALAAESYAADGGTPTLSQMLWMIFGATADFSISGTTLTVKKQDGTAAMTFTLDDATNPTSRTRAT